jgi:hypothetical protein
MKLHSGSVTGLTFLKHKQDKKYFKPPATVSILRTPQGASIPFVCQTATMEVEFPEDSATSHLHTGFLGFSLLSSKF